MPRPWSVTNLFAALLFAFVISMGVILAGFAWYVTLQANQLHEKTRQTLFESIQAELEAHYHPLRSRLQEYRARFHKTHENVLERLEPVGDITTLDISELQARVNKRVEVPLDVYLINPAGRIVKATYPPDENLDFHHPALVDGLTMIERAHLDNSVVTGPPVLEAVARELRIYTYSPLGDTGYTLELGFVPLDLTRQLREIEQRLQQRSSFDAKLHFLMWNDWALSLSRDPAAGSSKIEQLNTLYREKDPLLKLLRRARDEGQPIPKGEGAPRTYYVHLMDLDAEAQLPMDVLAEVRLSVDPAAETRTALLSAAMVTVLLLAGTVVVVFVLMRQTLARPLSEATAAMENWKPLTLSRSGRMVRELQLLASHYNTLLDRTRSRMDGLSRKARTDSLTQLANRFQLEDELSVELRRSDRYRDPLSIIFMDVDHFKSINDRFGHLTGDRLLQRLASLLDEHTREADTVGRWGGEEFLIICRHTPLDEAASVAESLRRAIADTPILESEPCTASFGVAGFIQGDDPESIMARADTALYRAKRGGRNRVISEGS